MKSKLIATILIGFYTFLLYYYRDYFFSDIDLVVASGFEPIFTVFGLIILTHSFRSFKFALIARYADPNQTPTRLISIYFYTLSVCILPGKPTELWRIRELAEVQKLGYARSLIINLADKMTDVLGLLVFGTFAVWMVARSVDFTFFGGIETSAIVATITLSIFFVTAVGFATKQIMKKLTQKVYVYVSELSYFLRPAILAKILLITIFAWFPEIISFYILIGLISGEWGQSTSILSSYALANIIGGFIPLPGGAVGFEGSLFLLLTLAQITAGTFTTILCHRLTAMVTTLLVGLCFLMQRLLKNEN